MGWFDSFLGNTDPDKIKNMMLDNPMMSQMQSSIDDFTDIGSDFYKRGQEFFSNTFGQQAANQAYTARNMAEENAALTGGPQASFLQNAVGQVTNIGANAFKQTQKSLFDMYNKGQEMAQNYTGMMSDTYNQANQAAASQTSQNAANKGSFFQNAVGTAAGLLFGSDINMKENVVPTGTNFKGLPKYIFNYI